MKKTPGQVAEGSQLRADYTLKISADSGYKSTEKGRCSSNQYAVACRVLQDVELAARIFAALEKETDAALAVVTARPQIEAEARANAVEAVKRFILGGSFLHDQAPPKLFAQEVTKEITNRGIGLAALPPTHQVVPVEPTEAMIEAGDNAYGLCNAIERIYKAMLTASKVDA